MLYNMYPRLPAGLPFLGGPLCRISFVTPADTPTRRRRKQFFSPHGLRPDVVYYMLRSRYTKKLLMAEMIKTT